MKPVLTLIAVLLFVATPASAQIPHGQDHAPNPPRSPADAIKRMTVPDGFSVELVASEPDIVNPVAMTFDERGRIWITESLEYPRKDAGKGRDRIKILEDTDQDGVADKFTIFADGLNIPSGIAVGHGGVWVANSPDLLFLKDTDGDDRADESRVIVTGFGRDDTHELPNSLTWGPDGWLYGLNGVFNPSHIQNCGEEYKFTCALFRINPRPYEEGPWKGEHAFEVFCEGTSNPWGVAFDNEGSAFVSACVIDHLWHLTETGYYHRQGGPYPPFTWKIDSIVNHKHQKAAYCGLTWFDSDAYPEEYRNQLYMGNIHGGCINVDRLTRNGSTYRGHPRPDFLTANDAWFMPVAQKTGPDGCLYVLDWYDRYHCYQDANRDPEGIDRLKGRLYRVRYQDSPRGEKFDLAKATDKELIERLHSPNIYFRETAQRILAERGGKELQQRLRGLVMNDSAPRKARMSALWTLISIGPLDDEFHWDLLIHDDDTFRAWGVRAAGNQDSISVDVRDSVASMGVDSSRDVLVQVTIAANKIESLDPLPIFLDVLSRSGDDELVPRIVWQNLHPLLEDRGDEFVELIESRRDYSLSQVGNLLPRIMDRMLSGSNPDAVVLGKLFGMLSASDNLEAARRCLSRLTKRIQSGEVDEEQLEELRTQLAPHFQMILNMDLDDRPIYIDSALVAAHWKDPKALAFVKRMLSSSEYTDQRRVEALAALISANEPGIIEAVEELLGDPTGSQLLRQKTLETLSRINHPGVADTVLANFSGLEPTARNAAIETLTQRAAWSKVLLEAISRGEIESKYVNLTQIRKLAASNDPDIVRGVERIWGTVRTDRDPARAAVIEQVRTLFDRNLHAVDFENGERLFKEKCAVCHTMHGSGEEVGPDITDNGRGSLEQVLSNLLDPNLVIGNDYQARRVLTTDGRFFTGLLVEENDLRVVLKMQGGQMETIARDDVDEIAVSSVSLMPENLEKDLAEQDLIDLIAFTASDPIESNSFRQWIPGVRPHAPQNITDPDKYGLIMNVFAPGFSTDRVGERGLGVVDEHFGRYNVLRTHPVNRDTPCVITSRVTVPANRTTKLRLGVSHEYGEGVRDWQLIVRANDRVLYDAIVGPDSTDDGWLDVTIDLSAYAGQTIDLELQNAANNWSWEFGYWDQIKIVVE